MINNMINRDYSDVKITRDEFNSLYPKVINGDMNAVKIMADSLQPFAEEYVIRHYGKRLSLTIEELASDIYETVYNFVKTTAKKGMKEKDYISFHTQLKTYIKRTIERIERKETRHLLTLVDLKNVKSNSSVDKILDNNKNEKINEVLNTLSERDRKVVVLHLGMYDGKPKTFNQIAKLLHIGPSRAHQIYVRAIGKLRTPQNSIKLVDYNV